MAHRPATGTRTTGSVLASDRIPHKDPQDLARFGKIWQDWMVCTLRRPAIGRQPRSESARPRLHAGVSQLEFHPVVWGDIVWIFKRSLDAWPARDGQILLPFPGVPALW